MATNIEDAIPVGEASGTSTTWLLIYTGLGLLGVHQVYKLTHFKRMGVSGPIPFPFIGNMFELGWKGMVTSMEKWKNNYGTYYGQYFGTQPVLVIADPDLARHVLIKDFSSFQKRTTSQLSIPYLSDSILEATGEVWKRGRSYISPSFSGSKMKQMVPDINRKCDILIEVLDEKTKGGQSTDIKDVIGPFVIDNVACCAYGLESDCQRDPKDAFLVNTKKMLEFSLMNFGLLVKMAFPFASPWLNKVAAFDILDRDCVEFFASCVKRTIEMRKESGETDGKKDFLQLMIDAAEEGGVQSATGDKNGHVQPTKRKIPLTEKELIGQSVLFFFAGYDTISTTMSFAIYTIARFPEVQKKLREEVDELITEGDVPYEVVSKMEYLEKVWNESQRLWPIGFILERTCTKSFTYNGRTIPEGQYMNIDVWNIHHDEKFWPNPYTFDPENHSKEAKEKRHPCTFMPFGDGPRICVAQRFALLEGKIGLIRLMQKYNFELDTDKTPDLDDVTNMGSSGGTLYPPKGIHIKFTPRE